jgi:hypothetical protein
VFRPELHELVAQLPVVLTLHVVRSLGSRRPGCDAQTCMSFVLGRNILPFAAGRKQLQAQPSRSSWRNRWLAGDLHPYNALNSALNISLRALDKA